MPRDVDDEDLNCLPKVDAERTELVRRKESELGLHQDWMAQYAAEVWNASSSPATEKASSLAPRFDYVSKVTPSLARIAAEGSQIMESEALKDVVQQVKGATERTLGQSKANESLPPVSEIITRGRDEAARIASSESFQNVVQQVKGATDRTLGQSKANEILPPVSEIITRGRDEAARIASSESFQDVVQQVKGATDRTLGQSKANEILPPVSEIITRGRDEAARIASSESFQDVVQQVKGATDRTLGQSKANEILPPVSEIITRGRDEAARIASSESFQNVVQQVKGATDRTLGQSKANESLPPVSEIITRGRDEAARIASSESFQNVVQQVKGATDRTLGQSKANESLPPVSEIITRGRDEVVPRSRDEVVPRGRDEAARIASSDTLQNVVPQVKGATERTLGQPKANEILPPVPEILTRSRDEVVPRSRDEVVPRSRDEVVPRSRDEVVPRSRDEVVPRSRDEVVPRSRDEVVPRSRDEVVPRSRDEVVPRSRDEVVPRSRDEVVPRSRDEVVPRSRDEVVPRSRDEVVPRSRDQVVPRGRDEVAKVASSELSQSLFKQDKNATDKTIGQLARVVTDRVPVVPDLVSVASRRPEEISRPATQSASWNSKIDIVAKLLAEQIERIPLERRPAFTAALIEFTSKQPGASDLSTLKLSSLVQNMPLDVREPAERIIKTAISMVSANSGNRSVSVVAETLENQRPINFKFLTDSAALATRETKTDTTKFFLDAAKANSFSIAESNTVNAVKRNALTPYYSQPAGYSANRIVPAALIGSSSPAEIPFSKVVSSPYVTSPGDRHSSVPAALSIPINLTQSNGCAALNGISAIDSKQHLQPNSAFEQEGGADDPVVEATDLKPVKKRWIRPSNSEVLEITGVEIALVGALIVAAVAKLQPDATQNSATVLAVNKVLYRPKYLVERRDTLLRLGEEGFGDARYGWLILELNAGCFSQEWRGDICVVTVKARQEIDLPVMQDIAEFNQRIDSYAGKTIVSIVTENAFDRELLQKRLGSVT